MEEGEGEEECFKKGSMVEVSSDDQGLRGSWFTATVLRSVSRRSHKIFVQYKTLVTTKDPKKPLREFVDVVLVRPLPPREPHRSFRLSEEVDAFHLDGWWEGIVTAVHPHPHPSGGGGGGDNDDHDTSSSSSVDSVTYSVFFRHSREQIDFPGSDLRLHREWVYGKWVPPLEDSPPSPPRYQSPVVAKAMTQEQQLQRKRKAR